MPLVNMLGLAETINLLRAHGYTEDYNLPGSSLASSAEGEELVVDQVFRFDVLTDPDDQAVLYALHSEKTGARGLLVNGFGIYSDPGTDLKIQMLLRWEHKAGKPAA